MTVAKLRIGVLTLVLCMEISACFQGNKQSFGSFSGPSSHIDFQKYFRSSSPGVARATATTSGKSASASARASVRISGGTTGQDNVAEAHAVSFGGSTVAEAISESGAVAVSRDEIVRTVVNTFKNVKNGEEAEVEAFIAAKAIGKAIATAYARASVFLEVSGDGFASGRGIANSRAIAEASAMVIAEGFAQAANELQLAEARIVGQAVTTAVAEAIATARAEAVLRSHGTVTSVQENIAKAVAEPIAEVLGEALALVFEGSSETFAFIEANNTIKEDVDAQSLTDVDTQGEGNGDGSGDAVAETAALDKFTQVDTEAGTFDRTSGNEPAIPANPNTQTRTVSYPTSANSNPNTNGGAVVPPSGGMFEPTPVIVATQPPKSRSNGDASPVKTNSKRKPSFLKRRWRFIKRNFGSKRFGLREGRTTFRYCMRGGAWKRCRD